MFKVVVVSASAPSDSFDTPDCYVVMAGSGRSKTKEDTTTPTWNEELGTLSYASLNAVSF